MAKFSYRYRTDKIKIRTPKPPKTAQQKFTNLIRNLPLILTGKRPRYNKTERTLYNIFWSTITLSLFESIYEAYETKSEGGTDDLGKKWADLSPTTKAYKRDKRGFLSSNQRRKYKADTPGLLSPTQHATWKQKYSEVLRAELRRMKREGDTDLSEAKHKAAASAWVDAKNRGAETLIDTLGDADMLIMRVTDTLYNSLKPGKIVAGKYRKGDENQVIKVTPGELEIGTKVPYAKFASKWVGTASPRKGFKAEVRREFLPQKLGIWQDKAVEAGRDAIAKELEKIAKTKRL